MIPAQKGKPGGTGAAQILKYLTDKFIQNDSFLLFQGRLLKKGVVWR
jgi:hypothetical protein